MWPFLKKTKLSSLYPPTFVFPQTAAKIDKFLTCALASGLIGFSELRDACAGFDTSRTDDDAVNDLRNHLAAQDTLTEWQCEKLRQGKFKGFFLDGYCLLRQLGKTENLCIYLGREVSTGKLVELDITPLPIDPVKDGRIHYTVREITDEIRHDVE